MASYWRNVNGGVTDTTIVRESDLKLLYRSSWLGDHLWLRHREGQDPTIGELGPIAVQTGGNAVLDPSNYESLRLLLQSVVLNEDWAASLRVVSPESMGSGYQGVIGLRVIGQERLRVPAGEYLTWKIEFNVAGVHHLWWVDRDAQMVVQTETSTNSPDTVYRQELLAWHPA